MFDKVKHIKGSLMGIFEITSFKLTAQRAHWIKSDQIWKPSTREFPQILFEFLHPFYRKC